MKKIAVLIPMIALTGCMASYSENQLKVPEGKLDSSKGVAISIPENGRYNAIIYAYSGQDTASSVRSAFANHAPVVDILDDCEPKDCLGQIDPSTYGYYVKPEILHWEDRATEWSCIPDKVEIRLTVFETSNKAVINSLVFTGKSKLMTFGGDHPQDLLKKPVTKFVDSMY